MSVDVSCFRRRLSERKINTSLGDSHMLSLTSFAFVGAVVRIK